MMGSVISVMGGVTQSGVNITTPKLIMKCFIPRTAQQIDYNYQFNLLKNVSSYV